MTDRIAAAAKQAEAIRASADQAAPPPPDSLLVSALRGRVLAAIASGVSFATSVTLLYQQVSALASDGMAGMSADRVATVASQATTVVDAGFATAIAVASLIGLLASINSKAREWLKSRF